MCVTTIILAQINKYIRIFRQANATSPSRAIIPWEYGIRNSLVFQKLVRQGIFVPVNEERYYMDEIKEAAYRKQRQSIAAILLLLLLAGLIIGLVMNVW